MSYVLQLTVNKVLSALLNQTFPSFFLPFPWNFTHDLNVQIQHVLRPVIYTFTQKHENDVYAPDMLISQHVLILRLLNKINKVVRSVNQRTHTHKKEFFNTVS